MIYSCDLILADLKFPPLIAGAGSTPVSEHMHRMTTHQLAVKAYIYKHF